MENTITPSSVSSISSVKSSIKKLLIANRGEIACRIIKTARRLGIKTVAVYSDADYQALPTTMADQAVYIGPSPATESYLKTESILKVSREHEIDAIHPGYGFLSENPAFARQCHDQGIIFIGPSADAIQSMGSKSDAKQLMEVAGVPMVPGYHGTDQSDQILQKEAERIGYPLLIKAAYGGGGKGMRVVENSQSLIQELSAARSEALKAFGNDELLLERFVTTARHVEVQIFFDSYGNGVYLFDRDCSLQRRHQKVIEEAPAPGLSPELRKTMGDAAVAAGKAIHYKGAGTVEFLLEGEQFYFMEMNTRLQVEHPVTEMVTGLDLVEWQLRTAMGESLPLQQHELQCEGHAIEARIYAEDPHNQFLPTSGRIMSLQWPSERGSVRVDAGIQQGDSVSSCYDPMLAKIIAYSDQRSSALRRLEQALGSYCQAGVTDNRDFLIQLIREPGFQQAELHTHFIEQHPFQPLNPEQERQILAIAALYQFENNLSLSTTGIAGTQSAVQTLYPEDRPVMVRVEKSGSAYELRFPDGHCVCSVSWEKDSQGVSAQLGIHQLNLACRIVSLPGQKLKVFLPDCSHVVGLPGYNSGHNNNANQALSAPMNGTIARVLVSPGQVVEEGAPLVIVEAMKMEHCVEAPESGVVEKILFQSGDRVEAGAQLLTFEEDSSHEAA